MKKILFIVCIVGVLQAENFELFLKNAIQNSPYLKANQLNIKQANEQSSITTRYKNPSLELEVSNFAVNNLGNKSGYRSTITQPIRLWGVSRDREVLASAQITQTKSFVELSQAKFVLQLSLFYSNYKNALKAESLAKQELNISTKILKISKARFENGTIARVKYIQAKVDMRRVKNFLNQMQVKKLSAYYRLISFSGSTKEINIENDYEFNLNGNNSVVNSAQLTYTKSKTASASALAELNSNKLEWIDVYGTFEKEPDQGIARVGVSIPLVVFNTKSQEKRIAQLEAKKSDLISKNTNNVLTLRLTNLSKSIVALIKLEKSTSKLLKDQEELLNMYEDGYKIASINLIELQLIKNQMIQTKAELINIDTQKEQSIIKHNFLTGEYNE